MKQKGLMNRLKITRKGLMMIFVLERIFHCGPSSKDGGVRIGSIVEIRETDAYHSMLDELCHNSPLILS